MAAADPQPPPFERRFAGARAAEPGVDRFMKCQNLIFLALITARPPLAFADPPSSVLVSVKLSRGSETIVGYAAHSSADELGRESPIGAEVIEEILRSSPRLEVYPTNLKLIDYPEKPTYIFTGPAKIVDGRSLGKIQIGKGPLDGQTEFQAPFFSVSAKLAEQMSSFPHFQCRTRYYPPAADEDPGIQLAWVSFNSGVGEQELSRECNDRFPRKRHVLDEFGSHERFKDVYWFKWYVSD